MGGRRGDRENLWAVSALGSEDHPPAQWFEQYPSREFGGYVEDETDRKVDLSVRSQDHAAVGVTLSRRSLEFSEVRMSGLQYKGDETL